MPAWYGLATKTLHHTFSEGFVSIPTVFPQVYPKPFLYSKCLIFYTPVQVFFSVLIHAKALFTSRSGLQPSKRCQASLLLYFLGLGLSQTQIWTVVYHIRFYCVRKAHWRSQCLVDFDVLSKSFFIRLSNFTHTDTAASGLAFMRLTEVLLTSLPHNSCYLLSELW